MQRVRDMVEQGQVRQVQIIMCGRIEGADEAWNKVGRSEAKGRRVGIPKGMGPELWRKVTEEIWGVARTYWGCLYWILLFQY